MPASGNASRNDEKGSTILADNFIANVGPYLASMAKLECDRELSARCAGLATFVDASGVPVFSKRW
jgi:hypothetical protein